LPARGVIVAGRHEREARPGEIAARFAAEAGYPVLADPLSGARRGAAAISHYDLLLREPGRLGDLARPELVIRVGDLPTSKPLRAWLAGLGGVRQVAFDPDGAWQDPAGVVSDRIAGDPAHALAMLELPTPRDEGWLARWRAADCAVADALVEALGEELSEPLVARGLGEWLGGEDTLLVASSMPIRDVEEFMAASEDPPRVLSSRGANGIDGTVSTAYGLSAASSGRVVALIGDVALAHDIGGLLAARRTGLPLTIVLLNNDGGGIFHFLPVAGERDAFEEHVATPHGLRFELAAEFYGCSYERPADLTGLRAALEGSRERPGTTIIEVRTDRERNLALHRQLAAVSLAALDGLQAAAR
jgi:2-succinyl-5-enolpyruvyl-6-hydroxy-3-cyclohexene-1-carboxylate synthase